MRRKKSVVFLAFAAMAVLLDGCGMEMQADVGTKQIDQTADFYLTSDEYQQVDRYMQTLKLMQKMNMLGNASGPAALLVSGFEEAKPVEVERDGKKYYKYSQSYSIPKEKFADYLILLDDDKFIDYSKPFADANRVLPAAKALTGVEGMPGMEQLLSGMDKPEFTTMEYTFDKEVIGTNGKIDPENPKKVDFAEAEGKWYAIFSKKTAECRTVTANLPECTNQSALRFDSEGVIREIVINGKVFVPRYYSAETSEGKKISGGEYLFEKEGAYKAKVSLTSGYQKTFRVVYDTTAPKISLSGKKLKISEKHGIKKVTVDGKKVNYKSYTFSKSGTYRVKAEDKAGNVGTKKIKYKKK